MGSMNVRAVNYITVASFLLAFACDKGPEPDPDPLGTSWQIVETWPSSSVNCLVWGDTLCVAVGGNGVVHTSPDGLIWTNRPNDLLYNLYDVAWTGDRFVAVGTNGTIATSEDGVVWTVQDTPSQTALRQVAATGDSIVVSGFSGVLMVTTNGTDWAQHSSGIGITFEDILFYDTLWLACGDSGMTAVSQDGVAWGRRPTGLAENCRLVSLTRAGDDLFAVGVRDGMPGTGKSFIYSSSDAVNWELATSLDGVLLRDVDWTGTELVAVGVKSITYSDEPESVLLTSPNGILWDNLPCDVPVALNTVITVTGAVTAAGETGYIAAAASPNLLAIARSGVTITDIAYNGQGFLGVTDLGTIVTSESGANWEERHSYAATHFSKLVYNRDKYVAVGGADDEARSLFFSTDGQYWSRVWDPVGGEIFDLIRGGGQYVGVGEYGHIFLSDDGQSWNRIAGPGAVDLRSTAWNSRSYLALGDSTAHLSSEGTAWSDHDIEAPEGSSIGQVIWTGDRFGAVGYRVPQLGDPYYCFFSSNDGYNWSAKKLPSTLISPTDLIWTGARFFMFGRYGTLLTSVDGEAWEVLDTGTESLLGCMAVSSRRLVLAGSNRTILRAER